MTVVFPYDPQGDFECPKCGWPEGFLTEYSKIEWSVDASSLTSLVQWNGSNVVTAQIQIAT